MIVMKFGGSSVASAERIREAAKIIASYGAEKPVVVLSALGDTTDFLLEAAEKALGGTVDLRAVQTLHQKTVAALGIDGTEVSALLADLDALLHGVSLLRELSKRSRDYLVSFGERLSVRIMAAHLSKTGFPARALDAWDAGFTSDSNYTNAELLERVWEDIPAAFAALDPGVIPIVTGFIAKDKSAHITTLGRGGSDLTATMLGAALGAAEVQTWKDVDGILTADPRIVPHGKVVPEVTYDEAAELAYFGSQILHPRSMNPCRKTGTLVRVKNSYNPAAPGSVIRRSHTDSPGGRLPVIAITSVKPVTLIDIVSTRMLGASGFLAHVFNQFLKWNTSVDVIATSEVSVSLTCNPNDDLSALVEDLRRAAEVECRGGKAIVAIICDAAHSCSILAAGFAALEREGVNVQMISQGASKVNVSLICDEDECERAVKALHRAFFEGA